MNSLFKNLFMKQDLIKKNKNSFFVKVVNTLREITKVLEVKEKKSLLSGLEEAVAHLKEDNLAGPRNAVLGLCK